MSVPTMSDPSYANTQPQTTGTRLAKRRDRTTEPLTAREQERLTALLLKRGGPLAKFWAWLLNGR